MPTKGGDARWVRQLRVFLASPGDVADERSAAMKVFRDLPYDPAFQDKLAVQVVAWDNIAGPPMEATMTPQEAIARGIPSPSQCDIFVAIFWARIGTPITMGKRRYPSGTCFELADAMRSAERTGAPRVLVYHRIDAVNLDPRAPDFEDRVSQFRSLEDYLATLTTSREHTIRAGINSFSGLEEFRTELGRHLRIILSDIVAARDRPTLTVSDPQSPPPSQFAEQVDVSWSGSPFRGLGFFEVVHEPIYFGREQEIDALVDLVRRQPCCAVVGASGSGKSSLIRAGVVPRLRGTSTDWAWRPLIFTPDQLGSRDPFASLAAAVMRDIPEVPARGLARSLLADPHAIERIADLPAEHGRPSRVLIVVDQFEELLTAVESRHLRPFVRLLSHAVESDRITLVLTVRGDFYGRVLDIPGMAALIRSGTFPLSIPTMTQLRDMVIKPALRAHIQYEEGLVDRILTDTGTSAGSLALLQYALDEIFRASDGSTLRHADYDSLGGVNGAIAARSEEVLASLDPAAQDALGSVFRELVDVDEHGMATRRRAPLDAVTGDRASRDLVETMIVARLLSVDSVGMEPSVEVAHEALLRSWSRLAEWIAGAADDLRLLRQVRLAAREWDAAGRPGSHLWPHERLVDVARLEEQLAVRFDEITAVFVRPEVERLQAEWRNARLPKYRRLAIIDRARTFGEPGQRFLLETLADQALGPTVKAAVIRALGNAKASLARSAILEYVPDRPNRELVEYTWGTLSDLEQAAIVAVGRLGPDPAVSRRLQQFVNASLPHHRHVLDNCSSVIVALGKMNDAGARQVLEQVAARKPGPAAEAAQAALSRGSRRPRRPATTPARASSSSSRERRNT